MTCFELRAATEDLDLKPTVLATLCGVKYVEAWRWLEGRTPVPAYVGTILSLIKHRQPALVLSGERYEWDVKKRHVFREGEAFKDLLRRWHPDVNKRDTKAEMQIVLRLRP